MAANPGRSQKSPLRNDATSKNIINSSTQAEEEHPRDIANTPPPSSPDLTINPADDLPFFGDLDYPSDIPTTQTIENNDPFSPSPSQSIALPVSPELKSTPQQNATTLNPSPTSPEPSIALTPRQKKVLNYRALRHMSNVRITKRSTLQDIKPDDLDDLNEYQQEHLQESLERQTAPSIPVPAISIPKPQIAPEPLETLVSTLEPSSKSHTRNVGASLASVRMPEMPPLQDLALPTTVGARLIAPLEEAAIHRTSPLADHPHHTLLAYKLRAKRHRKILLRHLTRKHRRRTRRTERQSFQKFWTTMLSSTLAFLIIVLSLGSAGAIFAYRYVSHVQTTYQHKVLTLRDLLPLDNLKMYDSKGVAIGQLTDNGIHTTVSLNQISPALQQATVATEDKYFWSNTGIDIQSILRAALHNLQRGRVVEGGSTITQQLIKNLVVGNEATIMRKLEEISLAPEVNSYYSKHDILEMYLNSIYYGHQAYGADAAATVYFGLEDKPGHPASAPLDLAQSAMLAGIPSNPTQYDPLRHPQIAYNRFVTVLNLMVSQRYITKVQALDAIREAQSPHFFKTAASLQNRAPHFFNFVLGQLQHMFHLKRNQLSRSGLSVYTTLDIALQDKIQKIAQQHIAELRDAHHVTNSAEVLIDFHTGAIISLLGSIDYYDKSIDGQFDVATQAYRQPGSSFKPYVYVTAFAQGASPAQAIDDKPLTIDLPDSDPPRFSPTNYDLHYHGHMTLRCALQNSLNVPGVKVLQHVGIDTAMQTARNMGITSYQGFPGYSLVLGGLGIRLLDHTSAMGVFANGGVRVGYYAISKVVSPSTGAVLYTHKQDPGKRVISPQLAYMMTNVLSDNNSRIPEFYDCNVLQLYSNSQQDCWYGDRGVVRPAAAKTGTTNDFRDNWTIGYTTDYVMGVWAGNDDNTPMIDVTGVQGAAPIWHDSMLVAEQGHPIQDFTNPGGLIRQEVTYPDGVQSTDLFLPGTVPTFTPTPTVQPTSTPDTTNGTPTDTPTSTPTPKPAPPSQPIPHAYCPSSYTFAFAPPSDSQTLSDTGWW